MSRLPPGHPLYHPSLSDEKPESLDDLAARSRASSSSSSGDGKSKFSKLGKWLAASTAGRKAMVDKDAAEHAKRKKDLENSKQALAEPQEHANSKASQS